MYYNRFPDRNIGFIPYVHKILEMLDSERLAIEPQLILNLDGGREMKKQEREVGVWRGEELKRMLEEGEMTDHGIDDGIDGPGEEDGPWAEGWDERNKGGSGDDIVDATKELQSRSLLHHKVGVCPQCERDMYVVSTKKAFGKPNQACECEHCGYVENG